MVDGAGNFVGHVDVGVFPTRCPSHYCGHRASVSHCSVPALPLQCTVYADSHTADAQSFVCWDLTLICHLIQNFALEPLIVYMSKSIFIYLLRSKRMLSS